MTKATIRIGGKQGEEHICEEVHCPFELHVDFANQEYSIKGKGQITTSGVLYKEDKIEITFS